MKEGPMDAIVRVASRSAANGLSVTSLCQVISNELDSRTGQPMVYQVKINSHLGRQWTDRFGLTTTLRER